MRLIDADVLDFGFPVTDGLNGMLKQIGIEMAKSRVMNAPTVDAAPVVRCKDCKHYDNSEGIQWCKLNSKFARWGTDWHSFPEDGFCFYGERKDNDET